MSDQEDSEEIAHLEEVNAELSSSLERCRALLRDCRSKLVANSNDNDERDEEAQGDSGRG